MLSVMFYFIGMEVAGKHFVSSLFYLVLFYKKWLKLFFKLNFFISLKKTRVK